MLFLDEIGELGRDEQAMLLRALEEKTFLTLASDRETHRLDFISESSRTLLSIEIVARAKIANIQALETRWLDTSRLKQTLGWWTACATLPKQRSYL